MIAPFSKKPLSLTLQGITTDDKDLSVSVARCYREANRTLIEKKKKKGRYDSHSDVTTSRVIWYLGWT